MEEGQDRLNCESADGAVVVSKHLGHGSFIIRDTPRQRHGRIIMPDSLEKGKWLSLKRYVPRSPCVSSRIVLVQLEMEVAFSR